MRTATGKPFSAGSLQDALLASHVAGIATCNGAQYDASSWLEPIIEPDRWERLVEMLTNQTMTKVMIARLSQLDIAGLLPASRDQAGRGCEGAAR
jgi:hypothetical protein